jgi:hypothetical protein
VPAAVIHQLPVPIGPASAVSSIAARARRLAGAPLPEDAAELQADVARLYGLTRDEFAHVLSTFPLIDAMDRAAAMRAAHGSGI